MASPEASTASRDNQPVHAIGWFDGRFGYNVHTRNFFECLSRILPVVASPLIGHDGPWREDRAALQELPKLLPRASIALLYGDMMDILDGAPGRRIAYTVWESTEFPPGWLDKLKRADKIWIPTAWGHSVLIDNGISADQVQVVPEGVDPQLFNPEIPPTDALKAFSGFKFLNVGRFEARKGTQLLIESFDREFGPNDDVRLVLACDNHHDPEFDIARILRDLWLQRPDRIVVIPPVRSHTRFAELYRACDAFVSPFRAEGWGLPVSEAMACGLPVIATNYSGPTGFLDESAYKLSYKLVPIEDDYYRSAANVGGFWAEPSRTHLRKLMREIYENSEESARRGRAGSRHILENFTWMDAARTASNLLSD
ncbi:glycosyltransferase [Nisaea sp.]|uniref:glycosyltransferase n=1 Tax=Nisaea sp. TaxID=2024842 RepID=UPI0032EABD9E